MSHLKSYILGYVLSLALTIEAYLLVVQHTFSVSVVVITILGLCIAQLLVQLFFFLHIDRAAQAPWNIFALLFMGLVVSIVVFGSLWIMKNLNYHMLTPAETTQYMRRNADL